MADHTANPEALRLLLARHQDAVDAALVEVQGQVRGLVEAAGALAVHGERSSAQRYAAAFAGTGRSLDRLRTAVTEAVPVRDALIPYAGQSRDFDQAITRSMVSERLAEQLRIFIVPLKVLVDVVAEASTARDRLDRVIAGAREQDQKMPPALDPAAWAALDQVRRQDIIEAARQARASDAALGRIRRLPASLTDAYSGFLQTASELQELGEADPRFGQPAQTDLTTLMDPILDPLGTLLDAATIFDEGLASPAWEVALAEADAQLAPVVARAVRVEKLAADAIPVSGTTATPAIPVAVSGPTVDDLIAAEERVTEAMAAVEVSIATLKQLPGQERVFALCKQIEQNYLRGTVASAWTVVTDGPDGRVAISELVMARIEMHNRMAFLRRERAMLLEVRRRFVAAHLGSVDPPRELTQAAVTAEVSSVLTWLRAAEADHRAASAVTECLDSLGRRVVDRFPEPDRTETRADLERWTEEARLEFLDLPPDPQLSPPGRAVVEAMRGVRERAAALDGAVTETTAASQALADFVRAHLHEFPLPRPDPSLVRRGRVAREAFLTARRELMAARTALDRQFKESTEAAIQARTQAAGAALVLDQTDANWALVAEAAGDVLASFAQRLAAAELGQRRAQQYAALGEDILDPDPASLADRVAVELGDAATTVRNQVVGTEDAIKGLNSVTLQLVEHLSRRPADGLDRQDWETELSKLAELLEARQSRVEREVATFLDAGHLLLLGRARLQNLRDRIEHLTRAGILDEWGRTTDAAFMLLTTTAVLEGNVNDIRRDALQATADARPEAILSRARDLLAASATPTGPLTAAPGPSSSPGHSTPPPTPVIHEIVRRAVDVQAPPAWKPRDLWDRLLDRYAQLGPVDPLGYRGRGSVEWWFRRDRFLRNFGWRWMRRIRGLQGIGEENSLRPLRLYSLSGGPFTDLQRIFDRTLQTSHPGLFQWAAFPWIGWPFERIETPQGTRWLFGLRRANPSFIPIMLRISEANGGAGFNYPPPALVNAHRIPLGPSGLVHLVFPDINAFAGAYVASVVDPWYMGTFGFTWGAGQGLKLHRERSPDRLFSTPLTGVFALAFVRAGVGVQIEFGDPHAPEVLVARIEVGVQHNQYGIPILPTLNRNGPSQWYTIPQTFLNVPRISLARRNRLTGELLPLVAPDSPFPVNLVNLLTEFQVRLHAYQDILGSTSWLGAQFSPGLKAKVRRAFRQALTNAALTRGKLPDFNGDGLLSVGGVILPESEQSLELLAAALSIASPELARLLRPGGGLVPAATGEGVTPADAVPVAVARTRAALEVIRPRLATARDFAAQEIALRAEANGLVELMERLHSRAAARSELRLHLKDRGDHIKVHEDNIRVALEAEVAAGPGSNGTAGRDELRRVIQKEIEELVEEFAKRSPGNAPLHLHPDVASLQTYMRTRLSSVVQVWLATCPLPYVIIDTSRSIPAWIDHLVGDTLWKEVWPLVEARCGQLGDRELLDRDEVSWPSADVERTVRTRVDEYAAHADRVAEPLRRELARVTDAHAFSDDLAHVQRVLELARNEVTIHEAAAQRMRGEILQGEECIVVLERELQDRAVEVEHLAVDEAGAALSERQELVRGLQTLQSYHVAAARARFTTQKSDFDTIKAHESIGRIYKRRLGGEGWTKQNRDHYIGHQISDLTEAARWHAQRVQAGRSTALEAYDGIDRNIAEIVDRLPLRRAETALALVAALRAPVHALLAAQILAAEGDVQQKDLDRWWPPPLRQTAEREMVAHWANHDRTSLPLRAALRGGEANPQAFFENTRIYPRLLRFAQAELEYHRRAGDSLRKVADDTRIYVANFSPLHPPKAYTTSGQSTRPPSGPLHPNPPSAPQRVA